MVPCHIWSHSVFTSADYDKKFYKMSKKDNNFCDYGQVDFHSRSWSNINMLIERKSATSYFIAAVVFDLSITVCDLFTVKMGMTLTLTFRMGQDQL